MLLLSVCTTTTTTVLRPFFRDHPGEPVPEEKLLDFMEQGMINRNRHDNHPASRHSIQTNLCPPPPSPHFLPARCPSWHPTNSVKALKALLVCKQNKSVLLLFSTTILANWCQIRHRNQPFAVVVHYFSPLTTNQLMHLPHLNADFSNLCLFPHYLHYLWTDS